jgi:hypothetical protein
MSLSNTTLGLLLTLIGFFFSLAALMSHSHPLFIITFVILTITGVVLYSATLVDWS